MQMLLIIGDQILETEREPNWCTYLPLGVRGRRGTMADAGGGRELLEPRLGPEGSREKLVLIPRSNICAVLKMLCLGERPFDWKASHNSNGPLTSSGLCEKHLFHIIISYQQKQIGEGLSSKDGGGRG